MATFDLPDSASDRTVGFTIPKEVDPYFLAFFQATKRDGDTANSFLLRLIGSQVLQYFAQGKIKEVEDILQATTPPRETVRTELIAFKATVGLD